MSAPVAKVLRAGEGTWLWWLGHPTRYVALGEDTGDLYALSWSASPPGGSAPPHRHPFEEGFYVAKGELTFTAGNQSVTVRAGGFVNIASATGHWPTNSGPDVAEVLVLVAPAGFDRFQMEAGRRISGPDERLGPPDAADVQRLRAAAPKYGIDLDPPAELFTQPPRITIRHRGEGRSVWVVGDRYTFLAEGEDTDGKYALWDAVVTPGGGPPPHVHSREVEGFFVLEGEVTFHAAGREVKAGPGAFLNLPRGVPHHFKNETNSVARMLVMVAPAGLEKMFLRTGLPVTDPTAVPPSVTPAEIQRLLTIAPEYGIDILLPGQHGHP